MMVAALLLLSAAQTATPSVERFILGRQGTQWFRVEVGSGKTEPVERLNRLAVHDAAVSADGKRIAWISTAAQASEQRLFALDLESEPAESRSIGGEHGRHADPAFSSDGKTVFFAHHPRGDGAPGSHSARANAQLYRATFAGGGVQALTDEVGCHLTPAASTKSSAAFFVHTDCRDGRWVVELDLQSGQRKEWTSRAGWALGFSVRPKGGIFVAMKDFGGAKFFLVERAGGKPELLGSLPSVGSTLRMWSGHESREFYIQSRDSFLRFDGKRFSPAAGDVN